MAKKEKLVSENELSKLVGKSRPAIRKWTQHGDWIFGPSPWRMSQVPLIKSWAAETLQEDRSAPLREGNADERPKGSFNAILTQAKATKTLREVEKLVLELQEKRGSMHDVEECKRRQIERVHQTKNALTSQVPLAVVNDLRKIERESGRQISDIDLAKLIRTHIEQTILHSLAPKEGD